MNAIEQKPIGCVLLALAEERGITSLEELAEAMNGAASFAESAQEYTVEELSDWPGPGFGKHVDAVLELGTAERLYLAGAWLERLEQA